MSHVKGLRHSKEIKKLGINNMLPIAHNIEMVNYVLPDRQETVDFQRRSELGQFMTPSQIAHFMASLFDRSRFEDIRLLDPGAGLGALSTAFLDAGFFDALNLRAALIDGAGDSEFIHQPIGNRFGVIRMLIHVVIVVVGLADLL